MPTPPTSWPTHDLNPSCPHPFHPQTPDLHRSLKTFLSGALNSSGTEQWLPSSGQPTTHCRLPLTSADPTGLTASPLLVGTPAEDRAPTPPSAKGHISESPPLSSPPTLGQAPGYTPMAPSKVPPSPNIPARASPRPPRPSQAPTQPLLQPAHPRGLRTSPRVPETPPRPPPPAAGHGSRPLRTVRGPALRPALCRAGHRRPLQPRRFGRRDAPTCVDVTASASAHPREECPAAQWSARPPLVTPRPHSPSRPSPLASCLPNPDDVSPLAGRLAFMQRIGWNRRRSHSGSRKADFRLLGRPARSPQTRVLKLRGAMPSCCVLLPAFLEHELCECESQLPHGRSWGGLRDRFSP